MTLLRFRLLALGLWSVCSGLSAEPPFSIVISSNQTVFAVGSPVELQVTFTNTSSRGIRMYWDKSNKAELCGFGAEVTDSAGNTPKISSFYNTLTGGKAPREALFDPDSTGIIVSSGGEIIVAPGAIQHLRMDVSTLFDLRQPGQYSVRVKFSDPWDSPPLMSNPMKITMEK